MTISPISDSTTAILHRALDGLTERQQAIATNLANLETPGYQAREVHFEDSLRRAATTGRIADAEISVTRSLAPTRLNRNNVNIDTEVLASSENALHTRLAINGLNAKYSALRTAIRGR